MLVLAATLAFVGVRYSNTGKHERDHFTAGPVQRVPAPLKAEALSSVDRDLVRQIAARFIDTAVLRRRLDDSWEITTPKLRQGLTRKQWDTGNIPVTPFPAHAVDQIKYTLDWSGANLVYLKVAIIAKQTANVAGQAFDIGLARNGRVEEHKWLVDYWVPSGLGVQTAAQRAKAAEGVQTSASKGVPGGLILVPIGALVLMILGLPVAIFGRNWLRSRRALREYRRHSA